MRIRELQPHDKAVWRKYWLEYVASNHTVLEDRIVDLTWSRLMTPDDPHESRGLAALNENEEVVGIAHYIFHRHGWLENDAMYIQDVYVDINERRKGYGRALFQKMMDIAEEHNSKLVYWMTQISNDSARKMYDDFGEVSPFVRYWKCDNQN